MKKALIEIIKFIICIAISIVTMWISFVGIMAALFKSYWIILLIAVLAINSISLYLTFCFIELNEEMKAKASE